MSKIVKFTIIAAFAVVFSAMSICAADANDSLVMPYRDGGNDGRDESVAGGASAGQNASRSEAIKLAEPATDASETRSDAVNQPSLGHGGAVSDPSLAMPAREGGNDGRDQSVGGQ